MLLPVWRSSSSFYLSLRCRDAQTVCYAVVGLDYQETFSSTDMTYLSYSYVCTSWEHNPLQLLWLTPNGV